LYLETVRNIFFLSLSFLRERRKAEISRVKFNNEEDYNVYNEEQLRREEQEGEEKEKELCEEEYRR
jgi:hypothetical protein